MPYAGTSSRQEALWRTHIADPPGIAAADLMTGLLVECWYERKAWMKERPKHEDVLRKGFRYKAKARIAYKSGSEDAMYCYFFSLLRREWCSADEPSCREEEERCAKEENNEPSPSHLSTYLDEQPELMQKFTEMGRSRFRQNPEERPPLMQCLSNPNYGISEYGSTAKKIHQVCANRTLFVTVKGYIGLGPWNAKVDDEVLVAPGGKTPFLIRRATDSDRYTMVGETYVYGIMGGEALTGSPELQPIHLV